MNVLITRRIIVQDPEHDILHDTTMVVNVLVQAMIHEGIKWAKDVVIRVHQTIDEQWYVTIHADAVQEDKPTTHDTPKNMAFIHECWRVFFSKPFDPEEPLKGIMLMEFILFVVDKFIEALDG